jgi:hypothetical protein
MSSVSYWLKGCSNIVYAYCLYKLVERLSPTGSAYQDAHPICSIKMHHAAKNGLQRSMRIGYAKMMGGENVENGLHSAGIHLLSQASHTMR